MRLLLNSTLLHKHIDFQFICFLLVFFSSLLRTTEYFCEDLLLHFRIEHFFTQSWSFRRFHFVVTWAVVVVAVAHRLCVRVVFFLSLLGIIQFIRNAQTELGISMENERRKKKKKESEQKGQTTAQKKTALCTVLVERTT